MELKQTKLFIYGCSMIFDTKFDQTNIVFKIGEKHITANFIDENVFSSDVTKVAFRKSFCDKFLPHRTGSLFGDYDKEEIEANLPNFFTELIHFVNEFGPLEDVSVSPATNVNFLDSGLYFQGFYIFEKSTDFTPVSILNTENEDYTS
ncbi:hypothetical protein [Latilactobacillus sakei]|uniref:hypothetical protein n=1 Tax=Latilactobacillus sakei TaxID=1599 RepID=UPI000DC642BD|nr:hypothetical protein [Latilactobacillus sakei]SPS04292.1 hypothetical protein LAS9624_01132 [Latilactobacillus sakei]